MKVCLMDRNGRGTNEHVSIWKIDGHLAIVVCMLRHKGGGGGVARTIADL